MSRAGRPRRDLLIRLARTGPAPRFDVGADHGLVAEAIGAIATERQPRRTGVSTVPWVIADGLDCFSHVGTAVIAGMGARSIGRILARGPSVQRAVLHAQDDPPALRRWLADHGWRIVEEGLAPEAGRFAEVVVAVPGEERSEGLELEYGPVLLRERPLLLRPHLEQLTAHLTRLCERSRPSPAAFAVHSRRLEFIRGQLDLLSPPNHS